MLNSFNLAYWQQEFVDNYLKEPKAKSLLVAAAGTGKTATALYAASQMLSKNIVDETLIISDKAVIKEQWLYAAKSFGINLEGNIGNYLQGDGILINVLSARSKAFQKSLDNLGKAKRWLIIVDDPVYNKKSISEVINRLLKANKESKALFISRTIPEGHTFEAEFLFNSEYIIERSIIELPDTEIRISRFAPSFSLLRNLEKSPFSIDDITWREFEKLIATLLEKDGYEVELMRGTKDGGVDVIAVKDLGPTGYFKTLWQAKKNRKNNKVGISIVRELADTRQEFGASKGIIVTSSYLTKGALQRVDRDKYILGKVDRDDLNAWIKKTLFVNSYS